MNELTAKISECLECPQLARRCVLVEVTQAGSLLHLAVRDEGSGFVLKEAATMDPQKPYGRGIPLMRAMAQSVVFRHGGREVCLTFDARRCRDATCLHPT